MSSPSSINFGTVQVGQSQTQVVSLTNSGRSSTTISAIRVRNSQFQVSGVTLPIVLTAGQKIGVNVTFAPTASSSTSGNVIISGSTTSNSSLKIPVSGTGSSAPAPVGQLSIAPSTLNIGSTVVGSSGSGSGTLSASGSSVTITAASTNNAAFKVNGLSLPLTVAAGQNVPFTVTFSPTATGSLTATLSFTSNAQTSTTTESLTGTGTTQVGQLTLSPGTLSFGNVTLGSNSTQAGTLSASGAAVTVSSAAMSNSQFALSGASFPMTLNAGQSAEIYVVFSPTTSGTYSGTLTLNSNASITKTTESLSGVGIAPQYSVSLSWNPSTSSVAGYNIYRGTSPGSYTKLNSTVDPNTAYTDNNVTAGASYYYAATAVTSTGQESAYSTPIQVSIP